MNGGLVADGVQFSNYVGDGGGTYLGAFAKLPVPPGLWFPSPVAELMWVAGRGLAILRSRFEAFAAGQQAPVGTELMPTDAGASPQRLAGGAS